MKYASNHLLAAAFVATLGLAAHAQPAPPPEGGHPPGAQHRHGKFNPAQMHERMARRHEALREKLQLSPAQETAWTRYTSAVKPPAGLKRFDRQAWAGLTTPERIDQRRALRNERLAAMDRRDGATKAFYAMLTPEQKKVFDAETLRKGHGARGHHPRQG